MSSGRPRTQQPGSGRFTFGVYKRTRGNEPTPLSTATPSKPPELPVYSPQSIVPRATPHTSRDTPASPPSKAQQGYEWNSQEIPSVSGLVSASGQVLSTMDSMGIEDYVPASIPRPADRPRPAEPAGRLSGRDEISAFGRSNSGGSVASTASGVSEINSVIEMAGGDRSRVVAKALARALADKPDLALPTYGDNWAVDPFLILHNAVRRELLDLYTIIWSLERRSNIDVGAESEEILQWWSEFQLFCTSALDVERKGVFNGLLNTFGDENDKQTHINANFLRQQKEVLDQFRDIDPAIREFSHRPEQTNYDVMVLRLDYFTKSCTAYFVEMETTLEKIILKKFVPDDMLCLEKSLVKLMAATCGGPQSAYIVMSRWMEVATRDSWVSKFLDKRSQKLYAKWWKSFYQGHGKVANTFRKRAKQDQKPSSYASHSKWPLFR
mmetsp:Transcript_16332/g.40233  ORF Transcript_16332/g.40233 Transcript_16332/m.40233 type:complete len:439 (-) Transcript_16332:49-1365(-)